MSVVNWFGILFVFLFKKYFYFLILISSFRSLMSV